MECHAFIQITSRCASGILLNSQAFTRALLTAFTHYLLACLDIFLLIRPRQAQGWTNCSNYQAKKKKTFDRSRPSGDHRTGSPANIVKGH
jgi:hypothetical protein